MSETPTSAAQAAELAAAGLAQLVAAIEHLAESGRANEVRSALLVAEGAGRAIAVSGIRAIAAGRRDGVFGAAGYRSDAAAISDLIKYDPPEAKRRIAVADHVIAQVGITGDITPPRLPATAAVFADGGMSIRHVEVLLAALDSRAAHRVPAADLAVAERHLAALASQYTPAQLAVRAKDVIEALDQDGPEPDDRDPGVNELRITRRRDGGGTIVARYDDPERFGIIAAMIDGKAAPASGDERTTPQRQADALAEICGFAHTHDNTPVPTGGRRPQVIITIGLAELRARARAALLDTGQEISPAALRKLCCDADVIPVVLDGAGRPVDVGRKQRVVSEPLRRAVTARDRGCAHPGCDRPPSWCEVHHLIPWELGGATAIGNLIMLCRHHHRAVHHDGWEITINPRGRPVFRPPTWVDPDREALAA